MKKLKISNSLRDKVNNEILPISNCLEVLGWFFTIVSILYVISNRYSSSKETKAMLLAIGGAFLFVIFLITFFIKCINNYKKVSENEAYIDSQNCRKCIETKMEDGFHNHGLIYLDELIEYEGNLATNEDPHKCIVMVYTSDLATEKNAEYEVKNNIEKGVRYIVLFFANTCDEKEYANIKSLYKEENLVNLSQISEYKDSFDGRLAQTLGFDIMIYKDLSTLKGFFAVDFIPEVTPFRNNHQVYCGEKCNYGKKQEGKNPNPFYKEISFEIANQLYNEGLDLQKKNCKG